MSSRSYEKNGGVLESPAHGCVSMSWQRGEKKEEAVQFPRGRLRVGLQKPSRKSVCIDAVFRSSAGHNLEKHTQ